MTRSFVRHVPAIVLAQVAGQAMAVVTTVVLARRLGVADFGVYAFATAVVFVANVVTTFGTDMVLIREVARDQRLERCSAALGLQLVLSVGAIAVLVAASAIASLGGPDSIGRFSGALAVFSLSLIPGACFSVCSALVRGLAMLRTYAAFVVAAALLPLVATLLFVRAGDSPTRAMTVLLGAQVVLGLAGWARTASLIRTPSAGSAEAEAVAEHGEPRRRRGVRARRDDVVVMARSSGPIGWLGVVGVLAQRLSMLTVSMLAGPTATGWYTGASRIVESSKTGHTALATAAYPSMAASAASPDGDVAIALRRARRSGVVGGIVVTVVLLGLGRPLVDRVYGPAFVRSRDALAILALGIVPSTTATFRTLELLALRREREALRIMSSVLALLLVSTVVLVLAFGWIGACWAALAADVAAAGLLTWKARERRVASARQVDARTVVTAQGSVS